MQIAEIVAAFATLSEVQVTASTADVAIHIPAIDDTAHLVAATVLRVHHGFAPDGSPCLEIVVADGQTVRPCIVTDTDIVFAPADPLDVLDSQIRRIIPGMPPLVAYTEMMRELEYLGHTSFGDDIGTASGTLLLNRCFIAGAARFGLRPLAGVHWWQTAWERIGKDAFLPPWREDPLWNVMVAEASQAAERGLLRRSPRQPPVDERAAVARLTPADFDALAPTLSVVGLDDQFVQSWRRWIPITPATLVAVLLRGLPEATADISLYPEGAGGIDIVVPTDGGRRAFMQLRFAYADGDLAIDELRIPDGSRSQGLFQRLMFNAESLGARLGLQRLTIHATDVGAYAFASIGVYPRDPQLWQAVHRPD
jgi:hypothetical protein